MHCLLSLCMDCTLLRRVRDVRQKHRNDKIWRDPADWLDVWCYQTFVCKQGGREIKDMPVIGFWMSTEGECSAQQCGRKELLTISNRLVKWKELPCAFNSNPSQNRHEVTVYGEEGKCACFILFWNCWSIRAVMSLLGAHTLLKGTQNK